MSSCGVGTMTKAEHDRVCGLPTCDYAEADWKRVADSPWAATLPDWLGGKR